ncbi:MAG TPA: 30S ribosomal protein S16 [Acidimicrobiia bacterium]|jgi:small subunit ribosomal protein S16
MPVRIRLTRLGKKKQPTYRVVVVDSRRPRDGAYIEQIGRYDPRQDPSLIEIDNEKAVDWLRKGAQPSERARKLLEVSGAWTQFRVSRGDIHTIEPPKPVVSPEREIHVVGEVAESADEVETELATGVETDPAEGEAEITAGAAEHGAAAQGAAAYNAELEPDGMDAAAEDAAAEDAAAEDTAAEDTGAQAGAGASEEAPDIEGVLGSIEDQSGGDVADDAIAQPDEEDEQT